MAELSKKPKALDHPQAASLGLSLVCAWIAVHRLSEVQPSHNVLVIGEITLLFLAFRMLILMVLQALEVELVLGLSNYSKIKA